MFCSLHDHLFLLFHLASVNQKDKNRPYDEAEKSVKNYFTMNMQYFLGLITRQFGFIRVYCSLATAYFRRL